MSNIFITRVLHFKFQTNFVQIYKDNPWKQSTFWGADLFKEANIQFCDKSILKRVNAE